MSTDTRARAVVSDGRRRKPRMNIQRTAPRRSVKGLAFLRRTEPIGRAIVGDNSVVRLRADNGEFETRTMHRYAESGRTEGSRFGS